MNAGTNVSAWGSACYRSASLSASANGASRPYFVKMCAIQKRDGGVYGSYIDEPLLYVNNGTKYYLHSNDLYSVAAVTDSTGAVVERYTYDAYGRKTITDAGGAGRSSSTIGQPWGFTGRRDDAETGLMYFRARMYSPGLGRFVGRDPLKYVNGQNIYESYFVPNYKDPLGLCKCGPDITNAFFTYVWRIRQYMMNLPAQSKGMFSKYFFMRDIGTSIDFWYSAKDNTTGECKNTVWLAGKCVRATAINNILFGLVADAMGFLESTAANGAEYNNIEKGQGFEGPEQWGAYAIGYALWDSLSNTSSPGVNPNFGNQDMLTVPNMSELVANQLQQPKGFNPLRWESWFTWNALSSMSADFAKCEKPDRILRLKDIPKIGNGFFTGIKVPQGH